MVTRNRSGENKEEVSLVNPLTIYLVNENCVTF